MREPCALLFRNVEEKSDLHSDVRISERWIKFSICKAKSWAFLLLLLLFVNYLTFSYVIMIIFYFLKEVHFVNDNTINLLAEKFNLFLLVSLMFRSAVYKFWWYDYLKIFSNKYIEWFVFKVIIRTLWLIQ